MNKSVFKTIKKTMTEAQLLKKKNGKQMFVYLTSDPNYDYSK